MNPSVMVRPHVFRKNVDLLAEIYGLNPNLPELAKLKQRDDTTPDDDPKGLRWLAKLNPYAVAHIDPVTQVLVVDTGEQQPEEFLTSRTLVERFKPGLLTATDKFVIDGNGLHIYWPDGRLGATLLSCHLDTIERGSITLANRTARIAGQLFGITLTGDWLMGIQKNCNGIVFKLNRDGWWFIDEHILHG